MIGMKTIIKNAIGLVGICLMLGVVTSQAATLTVNTTADAGVGSFRQALQDANTNGEANVITFDIPLNDPGYTSIDNRFTIGLESVLPDLPLAALTIDNSQSQAVTVKGDGSFRIFYLIDSSVVTINNLTISNGLDGLGGGGIFMNDSTTLNIDASTISNNSCSQQGGAIFVGTNATVNATSCTIDSNTAGETGGGIYNNATVTITNSTISSNSAQYGGGMFNNATATLKNNIVALNSAIEGPDLLGRNFFGIPFTGSFNLIGNADGSEGLGSGTNHNGSTETPIDARLGPLQDNGGPTFTRAIAYGSPAIDQGYSPGIITDQSGHARPYDILSISNTGDGSDIGAFEVQLAPTSATVSIGGRVLSSRGGARGVSGATVFLTDMNGNTRMARANGLGYYQFVEVPTNETYFMSVVAKRYQFDAQAVTVVIQLTNLDFIALQWQR